MSGFNNIFCLEELKPYYNEFFDKLESIFDNRSKDFSSSFYSYLFPHYFDTKYIIEKLRVIE